MYVRLRYFGACDRLYHLRSSIDTAFEATVARAAHELQLGSVDVFVTAEIWRTKSKTLIHGFALSDREIIIRISASAQPVPLFESELSAVLAHELHHCKRWSGPGYGTTLREAIVSEGLACHYEVAFRGGALPSYVRAIPSATLATFISQMKPFLDRDEYDRALWFDGREDKACPPYLGYSVGYHLIQAAIEACAASAADLCWAPAMNFWIEPLDPERHCGPRVLQSGCSSNQNR